MEKEITYKKPLFRSRIGISYKPIVIAKSLEDGLADLVKTAQEEEQEAAWLYVHDDSKWYNLATNPIKTIKEPGNLKIGNLEIGMPIFGNKRKTHYHTHPKQFLEYNIRLVLEETRKLQPESSTSELEVKEQDIRNIFYIQHSFPSEVDINTYSNYIKRKGNDSLDFCIISPWFIAQIELYAAISSEAKQKYNELHQKSDIDLIKELGPDIWRKTPAQELAEETCRRINSQIPGLSISIRKHQGAEKWI